MKALEWERVIAEADDVGRTIIAEASKRQADLIVMRSRRRPHAAALLGSTAETVSRYAACPVLVVCEGEGECVGLSTCEIDLKRILITLFGSTIEHVLCRADCPLLVARPAVAKATSARAA